MRTEKRSIDAAFAITVLATLAVAILMSGFPSLGPKDYAAKAAALREAVTSGDTDKIKDVEKSFEKKIKGPERLLYLEERGRILSLAGDIPGSTTDYKNAVATSTYQRTGHNAAPVGEKSSKYSQPIYTNSVFEDAALDNLLALNLIAFGDINGAEAEIDAISSLYDSAEKEEQARKAAETATRENIDLENALKTIAARNARNYPDRTAVSCVSGEALGKYLKGALEENSGDFDKALADYKSVLELCPNSRFAAESAMRCARKCESEQDMSDLVNRFGNALGDDPIAANSGKLIVIFEAGLVRTRSHITIPVKCKGAEIAISLPAIEGQQNFPDELDISCGTIGAHTQTIFNLDEAAAKEMNDDYPSLVVRYVQAAASKTKSAPVDADLRCWLTLPQAVEIAELIIPAGHQTFKLATSSSFKDVEIDVADGATILIVASQTGRNLVVRSIVPGINKVITGKNK